MQHSATQTMGKVRESGKNIQLVYGNWFLKNIKTKIACTYFEHTFPLRHWYQKYKAYSNMIHFGFILTPEEKKKLSTPHSATPLWLCSSWTQGGEMGNEEQKQDKGPIILH